MGIKPGTIKPERGDIEKDHGWIDGGGGTGPCGDGGSAGIGGDRGP